VITPLLEGVQDGPPGAAGVRGLGRPDLDYAGVN
jgi:hypothetical protein